MTCQTIRAKWVVRIAAGSAEEPYEVEYFAQKHGITQQQARDIIKKHGPSRDANGRGSHGARAARVVARSRRRCFL